jgi:hypothetical protein
MTSGCTLRGSPITVYGSTVRGRGGRGQVDVIAHSSGTVREVRSRRLVPAHAFGASTRRRPHAPKGRSNSSSEHAGCRGATASAAADAPASAAAKTRPMLNRGGERVARPRREGRNVNCERGRAQRQYWTVVSDELRPLTFFHTPRASGTLRQVELAPPKDICVLHAPLTFSRAGPHCSSASCSRWPALHVASPPGCRRCASLRMRAAARATRDQVDSPKLARPPCSDDAGGLCAHAHVAPAPPMRTA